MLTWEEILELDLHSNIPCEWCEVSMIVKEAVMQGEDIEHLILLHDFCSQFDSKEDMEEAKAEIITNAINPELSEQYGYPWV